MTNIFNHFFVLLVNFLSSLEISLQWMIYEYAAESMRNINNEAQLLLRTINTNKARRDLLSVLWKARV